MAEITITTLGHHGDGIAPGPVYAPRTLPGETVTGALSGNRLEDVRILTPSDARVTPPCTHFKSCGGCQVHHGSDAFVAEWKLGIVSEALRAHGIAAPLRPIHTSPPRSRRRGLGTARRSRSNTCRPFTALARRRLSDNEIER